MEETIDAAIPHVFQERHVFLCFLSSLEMDLVVSTRWPLIDSGGVEGIERKASKSLQARDREAFWLVRQISWYAYILKLQIDWEYGQFWWRIPVIRFCIFGSDNEY